MAEEESDLREFNIDDSREETAGRAGLQILIGLLICGAAFFLYFKSATRSHEAKLLAVDAIPLLEKADVQSLNEAADKYKKVLELESDNPYAIAGLAYLHSLLWVEHGIEASQSQALQYTSDARLEQIATAERYAAEVLSNVGSKDIAKAKQVAQEVATSGGISDKLYFALGVALEKEGSLQAAKENFRKAHDLKANAPHYAVHLGDAFDAADETSNSALYWGRAVKANSNFVPATSRDLIAKIRRGESAEKVNETFKRFAAFPQEFFGPVDNAAMALTNAELHYREANGAKTLEAVEAVIGLIGKTPAALRLKGHALLLEGKTDEGFQALVEAHQAAPTADRYLFELAVAYTDGAKSDDAIKLLESQDANFKATAYFQVKLGNAYRSKKDAENAKKAYDKALELRQEYPDALLGQALLSWSIGKDDDAIKWFEKAATARTRFPEVYENIGVMFITKLGATTDGNKQLEMAETQYLAKSVGKAKLKTFYARCVETLTPKSYSLTLKWQAKLDALNKPVETQTAAAAPATP